MEMFYNNYMIIFIFENTKGIKHNEEIFKFIIKNKYEEEKLEKYE